MRRYYLTIEYDGTPFCGWEKQPPPLQSVQGCLEEALFQLTQERVEVFGSGRTDAGVHARGQGAHVTFKRHYTLERLLKGTNAYLLNLPIRVLTVCEVPLSFHARFSATMRHYRYVILNRSSPPALDRHRVWWVPCSLNVNAMARAAKHFEGTHHLSAFRASQCQAKSALKTICSADLVAHEDAIIFSFAARSFLHHQIRIMVGTLKKIGEGQWSERYILKLLENGSRKDAGPTAPPEGLFFERVSYAEDSFRL